MGSVSEPPDFFKWPKDGRGNLEVISLIQQARYKGLEIICFDIGSDQELDAMIGRDELMADNLTTQWRRVCSGQKVLGICGNMHSALAPMPYENPQHWLSLAGVLCGKYNLQVGSINVLLHRGTLALPGQTHTIELYDPLDQPDVRDGARCRHTLELHLPTATAATFWAAS